MGIRVVKALELRNLVVYIEQEKFTPENYECQMAYLGQIMPSFEQVLFLKHNNMASLFLMENMAESICLTTSPELAKQMQCEKKQIVVGYRNAQTFLKEEFEAAGELYISTEDGSVGTKGNVMDAIREQKLEADIIYACGPTPMLRAIKQYAEENGIECYISLEERMACGIGACLACVCKSKEKDAHSNVNNKRICKDGPVFLSTEVEI